MDADMEYPFSAALRELKDGSKVARAGWNGKDMFIWLEKGSSPQQFEARETETINGVGAELFELAGDNTATRMPHLCLRAADGSTVTGWLASQTDLLAEDWVRVPD